MCQCSCVGVCVRGAVLKFIVSKILSICVRPDRGRGVVHKKWAGAEKGRGRGVKKKQNCMDILYGWPSCDILDFFKNGFQRKFEFLGSPYCKFLQIGFLMRL